MNMMKLKNWRKNAFILMIIGPTQYIILTIIAMLFYAGGTLTDPSSPGYVFWGNFFSDLGRVIALSGDSNIISFSIFTITALILSFSFFPFSFAIPGFFRLDKKQFLLSKIGSLLGIICISFFIAGIFTPWDIFTSAHLIFSNLFNLTGVVVIFFYTLAILYNREYPNIYAYIYLTLFSFAIIYTIILLKLPKSITTEGLIIQVSLQKMVHYLFLVCFLIQGYGAWKQEKLNYNK
ncbi:MAG: hypothetical protein EAX89_09175 [Candidatus Lokiarchaeota archaeon]|nr:hypothetical protein [Candidatus Lokiarchaeota archaeon]